MPEMKQDKQTDIIKCQATERESDVCIHEVSICAHILTVMGVHTTP